MLKISKLFVALTVFQALEVCNAFQTPMNRQTSVVTDRRVAQTILWNGYDPHGDFDDDYRPDNEDWYKPSEPSKADRQRPTRQSRSSNNNNPRQGRNNNGRDNNGRNNNGNSRQKNGSFRDKNERRPRIDDVPTEMTDVNAHFFSRKTLDDPSFSNKVNNDELFRSICHGADISRPSRIQSLAWPQIMKGNHTIIADQTGSGKTLAYLVPLLQRALQSKPSKSSMYGTPRALVLAPTAELADQIRVVCDKIAESVPVKTVVVTATGKYSTSIRDQIRMIQRTPIDLLISTPGRIATILRTRNSGLDLSQLQTIVLDEVDILLVDETFGPQLRTIGASADIAQTQFIFVTATLPDKIVETVQREFAGVHQVRGPGLHRVAPTVKEKLVDVSVPPQFNRNADMCFDIKAQQLLKALRQNRCRRTIVFCNTVESCRQVENLLNRKDRRGKVYSVGAYHSAMTPDIRNANLAKFCRGEGGSKNDAMDSVLICTDRAARGVDFDASPVGHVVIFDFPKDPAEYVRRVGRTARAGRAGASTVFAYGWQLPIAKQVMGNRLDSVNGFQDMMTDDGIDDIKLDRDGRFRQSKKEANIKGNIEGGKLWKR